MPRAANSNGAEGLSQQPRGLRPDVVRLQSKWITLVVLSFESRPARRLLILLGVQRSFVGRAQEAQRFLAREATGLV